MLTKNSKFIGFMCSATVLVTVLLGFRLVAVHAPRLFALGWSCLELGAALYLSGKFLVWVQRCVCGAVNEALSNCVSLQPVGAVTNAGEAAE